MRPLQRPLIAASIAALSCANLASCKTTPQDEQKRQDRLPGEVQSFAARYPAYATVLNAELTRAKEAFEKAKREAKGEQLVERMKAANNIASSRIDAISRYESASKELKRLLRNMEIRRQPRQEVEHLLREGERALDHALSIIQRPVQSAAEMSAALTSASNRVRAASRPLRQIKSRLDRQRREQRKAARAVRKKQKDRKKQ